LMRARSRFCSRGAVADASHDSAAYKLIELFLSDVGLHNGSLLSVTYHVGSLGYGGRVEVTDSGERNFELDQHLVAVEKLCDTFP